MDTVDHGYNQPLGSWPKVEYNQMLIITVVFYYVGSKFGSIKLVDYTRMLIITEVIITVVHCNPNTFGTKRSGGSATAMKKSDGRERRKRILTDWLYCRLNRRMNKTDSDLHLQSTLVIVMSRYSDIFGIGIDIVIPGPKFYSIKAIDTVIYSI